MAANLERTVFSFESMYNPHMQGIPGGAIALGSLLLISACSIGGQEVQSPQPEKSKPPVKMEQRGRILGIGGVFFKYDMDGNKIELWQPLPAKP